MFRCISCMSSVSTSVPVVVVWCCCVGSAVVVVGVVVVLVVWVVVASRPWEVVIGLVVVVVGVDRFFFPPMSCPSRTFAKGSGSSVGASGGGSCAGRPWLSRPRFPRRSRVSTKAL